MKSWRNSKDMRLLVGLTIIILIFSCGPGKEKISDSSNLKSDSIEDGTATSLNEIEVKVPDLDYTSLDSLIRDQIRVLDAQYASTPFYADINGKIFFIVCDGVYEYGEDRFSGESKYGIVDESLKLVLDVSFDKIYNPDLTIKDCFEIKKGKKIGLFNYKTKELLEPQFDFISQGSIEVGNKGYGFKDGKWYEINNKPLKEIRVAEFNPISTIQKMNFDIENLGESMMYDSYYQILEDDIVEGRGVLIVPSFIEVFGLMPNSYYRGIILPERNMFDVGIETAKTKTTKTNSLGGDLIAFFVSAFEKGVYAREYVVESEKLVTYNINSPSMNSIEIPIYDQYGYLCRDFGQKVLNDSIVETFSNSRTKLDALYDFENKYSYFKILKNGAIKKLESDRYFDFTKFAIIDESYFKGCFGKLMDDADWENQKNVWRTDHLTVDDLDLMRNEIFAEYGYIFKSEKWSKYFSEKSWYKPKYDNVDKLLSETDRANIKTILRVTQLMNGKENEYLNRRPDFYYAGP